MNENTALYRAIEQAVILPCAGEMESIADVECDFSETYKKKVNRLIKDRSRPYYPLIKTTLRKTIFIIAAVLMMSTITVAAVPQLREWFVGLFVSQNENNADVHAVQGVDVLVSTEERLKNFDIKENNGFSLTYSNFSDVFENYFLNDEGYSFVSNELSDFLWFDYPMQLFCRFLNSYVDFENKAVYFDTDEFKDNLDVMMQMLTISQKNNTNELFDGLYINRSFPLMAGNYSYYQSINETPVVFRGLTKNKDVNSAHIQAGYAINNNTQLKEQALAFIKYTLSDEIQEIGATASGSLSFPVNMSVYDNAKLVAGSRTDDNNKIIGIDNDFMKAYIDIADNVNACTLYRDVSHSYYNDNVIGDIVDNYIHKGISKDKFIRQLSAATEIYLTE